MKPITSILLAACWILIPLISHAEMTSEKRAQVILNLHHQLDELNKLEAKGRDVEKEIVAISKVIKDLSSQQSE